MVIHPKARPVISTLSIPSPIKKYFSDLDWEIDLSNNTNPYLKDYSDYPDVKQSSLKNLYLKAILSINAPLRWESIAAPDITPENILFTVGSMEGLDLLLRTFSEPNKDLICVVSPTFPAYEHWALIHNLQIKTIPLQGDNLDQIVINDIIKWNPKLVFVCNPNNPTGTKLAPEVIQKLCDSIEGFVVVDEAYIEFSDQPSSVFHLNKYKNLIILRTFSKAWGLAGLRCGAIIADRLIINALRYVQLPFGFSSPSQSKVRGRLLYPKMMYASWQRIKRDREKMIKELSTLTCVTKVFESETNFLMLILQDFQKAMVILKEHKIHVMDCSSSLPNSMRVSLGTEEQNQKFLEAMKKTC